MKKVGFVFLILFALSFVSASEFPAPVDKYVDDFANVLTQSDVQDLRATLARVDQDTTAEIVVVIVNTTDPYVPADYRTKLFAEWKIGKADKDNGLLILYSVTENRIEVETGYGMEGILPDSKVGRILDEEYVPLRDEGDPIAGVVAATKAFAQVAEDNADELRSTSAGIAINYTYIFVTIGVLVVLLLVILFVPSGSDKEAPNSYGIKSDSFFRRVLPTMLTFSGVFSFLFGFAFLGIGLFVLAQLIPGIRGARCIKDGLRMKHQGQDGRYKTYCCSNGHVGGILALAAGAFFWGGGRGSGFGGGGFGGGGFGGGGSGGGGAGR